MIYYLLKVILSAVLIVVISEVAKRSSFFGALVASLPLTSLLALVWLYIETKDLQATTQLAYGIFWVVIPSLAFFISLPFFVKQGLNFWLSLTASVFVTGSVYWGYVHTLTRLGVKVFLK